jgi:predicted GNAT family acetyltransferase
VQLSLKHDPAQWQFRLTANGETVSLADYRLIDGGRTLLFHHTYTTPRHRDQGHAAELLRGALDDVRASGRKVAATCWYVLQFLDEHPEYADLRAS